MQSHQIIIPKTAYYYSIGTPTEQTQHFFFAFHGYGQLGSQIIHKFSDFGDAVCAVAPEGLSRFYWDDHRNYQIVGASWMTKLDRLVEIEDYCHYLQLVFDLFVSQLPPHAKIHLLGFSQGGATLLRWVLRNKPKVDSLIVWGAGFPTDLDYKENLVYFNDKYLLCVQGTKDPLISQAQIDENLAFIEAQGIKPAMLYFEGAHEIDRELLKSIVAKLG